ncbi:hypothetical protein DFP72DRAFT_859171 [Ephemerocybe angulata]|uniref:Uncharacterized protein n=1 Tax=Ephemerocybe angulata TaxID=980116 RepID=A0A8H6HA89_9AGAR|nr:hypothetical protein DFP72DRAFT_859171 [Tulosesus angulatus]
MVGLDAWLTTQCLKGLSGLRYDEGGLTGMHRGHERELGMENGMEFTQEFSKGMGYTKWRVGLGAGLTSRSHGIGVPGYGVPVSVCECSTALRWAKGSRVDRVGRGGDFCIFAINQGNRWFRLNVGQVWGSCFKVRWNFLHLHGQRRCIAGLGFGAHTCQVHAQLCDSIVSLMGTGAYAECFTVSTQSELPAPPRFTGGHSHLIGQDLS